MAMVWVNGIEGAGLAGDDPGFTRGLNVFETMRTYGRHVFRLELHLDRLAGSAAAMDIPMPAKALLRAEISELASRADNQVIRIALTAGNNRVTTLAPVDTARIGRPLRVATVHSQPPDYLPGSVKHGSRAAWVLACKKLNVDEVMFVDDDGYVLELNRSNVFAVVDNAVCTPPLDSGKLAGVTRGALLEAARQTGLEVRVHPLPVTSNWTELYASSTLKELAPVVAFNGRKLPAWGPVGRALQAEFAMIVERECPKHSRR